MKRNWFIWILIGVLLFLGVLLLKDSEGLDKQPPVLNQKPKPVIVFLKIAVVILLCALLSFALIRFFPALNQYWFSISVFVTVFSLVSIVLGLYGHYHRPKFSDFPQRVDRT